VPKRSAVVTFWFRDGDVVVIRASVDGEDLVIKDNHPLGVSASSQSGVAPVVL
jgi:hypothetical protein